jgi:hypothetical protein
MVSSVQQSVGQPAAPCSQKDTRTVATVWGLQETKWSDNPRQVPDPTSPGLLQQTPGQVSVLHYRPRARVPPDPCSRGRHPKNRGVHAIRLV